MLCGAARRGGRGGRSETAMAQAPRWTRGEFELILSGLELSAEELATQLPKRTTGAIEVVRWGIHNYHSGGDLTMLSRMMRRYLDERSEPLTCPACGVSF